ncbi:MAG: LacI family DNA-binding transcriptional regulator [Bacteroidales bacterium]
MENPDKKLTIKDIAEIAGVSTGTVDRVIHNRGEVSAKTREKILQITKQLNFQPHILASTLASKKATNFAVLMPGPDSDSSFWKIPEIGLTKAQNETAHYGIGIKKYLFTLSDKESFMKMANLAFSEKPDGLLIAPSFSDEGVKIASICNEREIPFVFFNCTPGDLGQLSFVGQDAKQSGKLAARLMDFSIQKGSELLIVSIVRHLKDNSHILMRKNGFIEYFENKKEREIQIYQLDFEGPEIDNLYSKLKEIFSIHPAIIGIFVPNSRVFHLAGFIGQEKLKDVKIIGFDLTNENKLLLQNETISFLINQKPVEQIYKAFYALFNTLVLKKQVPEKIWLPIEIVTKENLMYYEEY